MTEISGPRETFIGSLVIPFTPVLAHTRPSLLTITGRGCKAAWSLVRAHAGRCA